MSFDMIHIRESDRIITAKNMERDVALTMEYLDEMLVGTLHRGELLRQALSETGWRHESIDLAILTGRKYRFKGMKNGIAIEGSLHAYEFILEGLFRLQVSFDKGIIDTGILLITSQRSEHSPLGSSRDLAQREVLELYPTISLPVTLVLFDLGVPHIPTDKEQHDA